MDNAIFDKAALRRHFVTKRQQLSSEQWQLANERLLANIARQLKLENYDQFLLFFGVNGEPSLVVEPLLGAFRNAGEVFLPVVGKAGAMSFHRWDGEALNSNQFGIPEPAVSQPQPAQHRRTLIFVPCLAVDTKGHRLGYGKGYYDRYLAKYGQRFITIAVAFRPFVVESLPVETHDMPVEQVITD